MIARFVALGPRLDPFRTLQAKKVLFIGVGCQVQALRKVEKHLAHVEKLYVLGTNCVDNGTRQGFEKFRLNASETPDTVVRPGPAPHGAPQTARRNTLLPVNARHHSCAVPGDPGP